MAKITIEEHRKELIKLYTNQLEEAGKFMKVVLEEAIRKLCNCPNLNPTKVEDWVVNLEKSWNKLIK
jgi:hypothetical protein